MKRIVIHIPIWSSRSVKIDVAKITDDIEVECDWKDKSGERLFPKKYRFTKEEALNHPSRGWDKSLKREMIEVKL